MHWVYILRCADGSYYVGNTQDVAERVQIHSAGRGPSYTARRLPVQQVYQESAATISQGVRREKQLKGWSRAKKEALIAGDLELLARLAVSRQDRSAGTASSND